MDNKSVEAKTQLDSFFKHINELSNWFIYWTGNNPKELVINPDIIAHLSRVEGFYERDEIATQVDQHTRMVRRFKLDFGTIILMEDWEETFLHFE